MERQTTVTEVAIQIVVGFAIGWAIGTISNHIWRRVR
jgi:NhaP-type Na+/H+ or K+/H+ antiporter